ncbi:unnamed protein product [Clavelina lepadiformis]|uniref:Uncharacterized protein n=1 Tax=Clavelina lepadiformis TaxID=159417 RepID=A0ABP0GTR6_CLALP
MLSTFHWTYLSLRLSVLYFISANRGSSFFYLMAVYKLLCQWYPRRTHAAGSEMKHHVCTYILIGHTDGPDKAREPPSVLSQRRVSLLSGRISRVPATTISDKDRMTTYYFLESCNYEGPLINDVLLLFSKLANL